MKKPLFLEAAIMARGYVSKQERYLPDENVIFFLHVGSSHSEGWLFLFVSWSCLLLAAISMHLGRNELRQTPQTGK